MYAKPVTWRPSRKPLTPKKNCYARLWFAKEHLEWSTIGWAAVPYARLIKIDASFNRKDLENQVTAIKPGGGFLILLCFSRDTVGPMFKVMSIMTAAKFCNLLLRSMLPHSRGKLGNYWIFMHDNNPKRLTQMRKCWLDGNHVNVLQWPA